MDGAGDAMLKALLERLKGRVTMVLVTPRPSILNLSDRIYDIVGSDVVLRGSDMDRLGRSSQQVKTT